MPALAGSVYRERISTASILTREFGVDGVLKETLENDQIRLTYSASDSVLAPGSRFTLFLEMTPKPRMHLYAPGVKGYIPIDWQIANRGPRLHFRNRGPGLLSRCRIPSRTCSTCQSLRKLCRFMTALSGLFATSRSGLIPRLVQF